MNKLKRNKKTANKVLSIFLVFALVMTFFSLPQTVEKVYAQEEKIYFEFTDTSGGEKIYCCVDGILSNGQLESLIGK